MISFPVIGGMSGQYTIEKLSPNTFLLSGDGYPDIDGFEIERTE